MLMARESRVSIKTPEEQDLMRLAAQTRDRQLSFSQEGWHELTAIHARGRTRKPTAPPGPPCAPPHTPRSFEKV